MSTIAAPGFDRPSLRDYLLAALLALAVLAPGISALPPVDRDESRYAVATSQMLETGDFVDIRFLDGPRYLQPAGIYWLQAASVAMFSDVGAREIWAHRIPSLAGGVISVLLTLWMGALLFGRRAGLVAGGLLAVCLSLNFEARNAKIDATLLATIIVGQIALLRMYVPTVLATRSRLNAAVFWAAQGVGLMLKGPIILIVSLTTIAALVIWDRRIDWLKRLHAGWGILITLAIALPWLIAIGVISDGAFYARAVGKGFLGKVGKGEQGHAGPIGYHLLSFVLAFWPGALFAALGARFAATNRGDPAVRFLIAWIAPTWLIFEIVSTKLPHYVLPTYPAIACLAAAAAVRPGGWKLGRIERWLVGAYAVLWLLAGGVLAALGPVARYLIERQVDTLAIAGGVAAFLAILATLMLVVRNRPLPAITTAAIAAALIWSNTFAYALPRLPTLWLSPRLAAAFERNAPCPDSKLITTPYVEPSLVFLTAGRIVLVGDTGAADRLAVHPACDLALIGAPETQAFMARAAALGLTLTPLETHTGRNYADGDDYRLTLYRAASAASASRSNASN